MLTIGGGSWGLGFMVCGYNGTDIYLGPIIFSVQPPLPKWIQVKMPEGPAGDRGQAGWMGGESDR